MVHCKVITINYKLKLSINNRCALHGARGLVQQSRARYLVVQGPEARRLGRNFCPVGGPNLLPAALTLIELGHCRGLCISPLI